MRINSLDYLRGLMAIGIMFYHFFVWTFGTYESDTFLEKIGLYGVSVFYVPNKILLNLSGLFGFVAFDKYIPTGAWSIGNELVFYAFFPIVLILSKKINFF